LAKQTEIGPDADQTPLFSNPLLMMDLELDSAAKRFAKDNSARAQIAAAKREKLLAEREKSRRVAAQREAAKAAEEAAAAAKAAAEAELRERDLELNRGVYYLETLRPILSRAAEQRGIVRRADKVQLPPSAAASLSDASHNGVAAFEITAPNGASTHATLLDFSAPEGSIGMPESLLQALGLVPGLSGSVAGPSSSDTGAPVHSMPGAEPMDVSQLLPPLPQAVGGGGVSVRDSLRTPPLPSFRTTTLPLPSFGTTTPTQPPLVLV